VVRDTFPGSDDFVRRIAASLDAAGVRVVAEIPGAGPNCPREDLFRITDEVGRAGADVTVSFGGGSTIDATKAAGVLHVLGGNIDDYFGTGAVSSKLEKASAALLPHVAIQSAASSAAHLTKYSNITDVSTGQKKLIVDDAIVPPVAAFDYTTTYGAPRELTMDGALDGIAHSLEVLYGAVGKDFYDRVEEVAGTGIALVVNNLPKAIDNPQDTDARDALCLGTDLGGYSIMIGGTNGGHLTSFSLVDVLSHGRACALMNPYYTVFFAPAIERPLRLIGKIYRDAGLSTADFDVLSGAELGAEVARAMFALSDRIGFPKTLGDVTGFSESHIQRAVVAAKNPQLAMKLQNMPVPLTADMVDEYMLPILEAAKDGNLERIKTVS
jgi:alcohol dehydrogenase class IV